MPVLFAGIGEMDVDQELVDRAASRCSITRWRSASPAAPRVVLSSSLRGAAQLLDRTAPALGTYGIADSAVHAQITEDPRSAEAALKVGFAVSGARAGGLLIHSCAFRWDQTGAVVAVGPSGAGKSTLARFAVEAGAKLLSDETNLLLPGGRVFGTPFRSDTSLEPSPVLEPIRAVITLSKGSEEFLAPLAPHRVVARLLAQVYGLPQVLTSTELLQRADGLLRGVPSYDFTFRKDPVAAVWLRDELIRRSQPIP